MDLFIAEVIGTAVLMLLGSGVNANVSLRGTYGQNSGWIVITTGWGLAVFSGVVVARPISGAHLNPAVSVGLAVAGQFDWALVPTYILGQLLGASIGTFLVWVTYKDHFDQEESPDTKLGVFSTGPAIPNTFLNFFSEMIGTLALVFVVLHISGAVIDDPNQTPIGLGSVGALPVALLVWVIGMGLGGTTGYAINPARDLMPRVLHSVLPIKGKGSSKWHYAWIPVVAPLVGGAIGGLIFIALQ